MFDYYIREALEKSKVPEPVRLSLTIATKAAEWLPWVFFFFGLILNQQNFQYWLAFFLFAEGSLLATIIYILLLIVRDSLSAARSTNTPDEKAAAEKFSDTALKGVIVNFAFYLFIFACFVVIKGMGLFDLLFQSAVEKVK